jgi:hypothetical protein
MMEWFQAGGFGMFTILLLGVASVVVGVQAIREPSAGRLVALRSLPSLIVLNALFAFGMNLWAVNFHLSNDAFVKAQSWGASDLPLIAIMGVTEAGQALTLGGLLAAFVVALRIVAEVKNARMATA